MLRFLVFSAAMSASFAAGVVLGPRLRPTPPPQPSRAVQAAQLESCRDDCEQRAIVAQLPPPVLRACIARCDEKAPPPPPREVPRSISRASADHRDAPLPARPITVSDPTR